MKTPGRPVAGLAVAVAAAAAVAGCGSAAAPAAPAAWAPPAGASFLATSLVTTAGTWGIAVMGGSVASHNNFWQLFLRSAGRGRWKLVTPPGVPDNGGLAVASAGGRSVITGFRPSQGLTYTPLTASADGGQTWTSTGPLDGMLANVPDALAAAPGTGRLIALLADGTVRLAVPAYTRWETLATTRTIASTPAGHRCGLQTLTAAAYSPLGMPLLGGTCSRPGAAGIFAAVGGTWQAAGPAIPASLARQRITALRLTRAANQVVALLRAGSGHSASLLAAWSGDNGRHWALSPALPLDGAAVASASFGPAGTAAAITTAGRADVVTSGGSWNTLPTPPAGTATLVPGSGGQTDALAVRRGTLTIWQLPPGGSVWAKTQVIHVPIQYGSSG